MRMPETYADARPLLVARPAGRTPLGVRALALSAEEPPTSPEAVHTVAGDVVVGLALGVGVAHVPVTESMLALWGVEAGQAIEDSFAVHGGEHPLIDRVGAALVVRDPSFAAYVLLHPAVAAGLVGAVPVALAPVEGVLVLAPAADDGAVADAVRLAAQLLGEGRPVSASVLVADGDRWVPAPLAPAVDAVASDLRRRFAAQQYADQQPLLESFYARSGQEYAVATAMLVGDGSGDPELVATLREGVPTVLPWVDRLALVRGDAVVGYAPMPAVADAEGTLVALPDLDPPRWYATAFPEALAR